MGGQGAGLQDGTGWDETGRDGPDLPALSQDSRHAGSVPSVPFFGVPFFGGKPLVCTLLRALESRALLASHGILGRAQPTDFCGVGGEAWSRSGFAQGQEEMAISCWSVQAWREGGQQHRRR